MTQPEHTPATTSEGALDVSVPHSARIWNYWLGGKDNYEVDRTAGEAYKLVYPGIEYMARSARDFLTRAVSHLAGDEGVRQFLDIGTGLPAADNTHEVALRASPDCRVVYVDNDPMVLSHARAILTDPATALNPRVTYIDADVHNPEAILETARGYLDFEQPIALMLMGILGHVDSYDEARSIVSRLLEPLPSGSFLVLYESTDGEEELKQAQQGYDDGGSVPYRLRSVEQMTRYFDGLDLIEPGIASCSHWRAPEPPAKEAMTFGGVGRKP
ncbi:SAM-dependent methyltransferase [Streptomyces armeniacus]|uniref:SAM-dependent methyltransferase n=1 Tax=Streptomyces armeniacus TaxID=83291 RepID=A0A345XIA4_9ACTN|nr:SAM-dependent methyltransferase [Streptomyces armeniacus]AXK31370.1 SAM-dependent methyltransferase [Streptomyces armeniacus]